MQIPSWKTPLKVDRAVLPLKARSHGAIFSECDCDLLSENGMLRAIFSDFVHTVRCTGGCDFQCTCIGMHIAFTGIAHRNRTEWVWNLFGCDVAHKTVSHAERIAPCEHYHWHPHNPLHAIKKTQSHSEKIAPCERAVTSPGIVRYLKGWSHGAIGTVIFWSQQIGCMKFNASDPMLRLWQHY